MNDHVHVWALSDGLKAIVSIISPDTTMNEILDALALENVVMGISHLSLKHVLELVKSTGSPQNNIIAAQAIVNDHTIVIGNQSDIVTAEYIRQLKERARSTAVTLESMKNGKPVLNANSSIFTRKDECFCKINFAGDGTDIFGRQMHSSYPSELILQCDASIHTEKNETGIRYSAKKDGYLVALSSGVLSISDSVYISSDKMEMFFLCLPISWNKESFITVYEKQTEKNGKYPKQLIFQDVPTGKLIIEHTFTCETKSLKIMNGTAPVPGIDAKVIVFTSNSHGPAERKDGSVDLREVSAFQQVKEGALLVEKIPAVNGVAGCNVLVNWSRSILPRTKN